MPDNKVTVSPLTNKPLKVTVVGDGYVGKTSLLITHTTGEFSTEYVPTVFDNCKHDQVVDGVTYTLTLYDTAGQEDYEKLRPLSYPHTSVFIVCFSLNLRTSFDNISTKWLPELKAHCPKVPVLLVGTKKDVKDETVVTSKDGQRLCRKEGLVKYMECSAKTMEGIRDVFEAAAKASTGELKRKSKMCCIT